MFSCKNRIYIRKGMRSLFLNLIAEPSGPSYLTRQREMSLRRLPELWEELSFLHKPLRPWNSFEERMGFGLGKESSSSRWIHECRVEP